MSLQSHSSLRLPVAAPSLRVRPFPALISYRNIGAFVALLDFILIVTASLVAGVTYHSILLGQLGDTEAFTGIGANAALLFVLKKGGKRAKRLARS